MKEPFMNDYGRYTNQIVVTAFPFYTSETGWEIYIQHVVREPITNMLYLCSFILFIKLLTLLAKLSLSSKI